MKLKDFDFRIWKEDVGYINMRVDFERGACRLVPIDDDSLDLELWSGLCDKNGKRIYDGDILQSDGVKFVLFYKYREFVLRELKENGKFIFLNDDLEYEVLGKIHENAELLK